MSPAPPDPRGFVAGARRAGSLDLGGMRLDIVPGAELLLVSCSGLIPPGRTVYAHEHTELDPLLHRLFVCDSSNGWYLGGLPGLTPSIHAAIDLIGAVIAHLAPARAVSVGTSMGGYLSLLLGRAGLVDEAVAFAPQTILDRSWRAAQDDIRWRPEIEGGLAALAPLPPPDAAADAAPSGNRPARLHVFYPLGDRLDDAHATRLAGQPGVLLYPVRTCHHVLSNFLRARGVLRPVLSDILAGGVPLDRVAPLRDEAEDPELLYREATALLDRGDFVEAEQAFRRALATDAPPNHYFFGLADALWRQGRAEDALAIGGDAAAARPADPHAHFSLARLLARLHRDDEAEEGMRRALAMAPQERMFAAELCAFLVNLGRAGEAASLARAALGQVREAEPFRARMDALLGDGWIVSG